MPFWRKASSGRGGVAFYLGLALYLDGKFYIPTEHCELSALERGESEAFQLVTTWVCF